MTLQRIMWQLNLVLPSELLQQSQIRFQDKLNPEKQAGQKKTKCVQAKDGRQTLARPVVSVDDKSDGGPSQLA